MKSWWMHKVEWLEISKTIECIDSSMNYWFASHRNGLVPFGLCVLLESCRCSWINYVDNYIEVSERKQARERSEKRNEHEWSPRRELLTEVVEFFSISIVFSVYAFCLADIMNVKHRLARISYWTVRAAFIRASLLIVLHTFDRSNQSEKQIILLQMMHFSSWVIW